MLKLEVLIRELGSINALPTGPITIREITTLAHKTLDHTVES